MTALSSKSAQEICCLLDEYGIKHGPVVDSTRALYEKKLKAAMAADKPVKQSPDKTYYREEEEEITYIHRRAPLRTETFTDSGRPYYTSTPDYREPEDKIGEQVYRSEATHRYISQSQPPPARSTPAAAPLKESGSHSGRLVPLWLQFLVFLVVATFLYYVFTTMEAPETNPFKRVD